MTTPLTYPLANYKNLITHVIGKFGVVLDNDGQSYRIVEYCNGCEVGQPDRPLLLRQHPEEFETEAAAALVAASLYETLMKELRERQKALDLEYEKLQASLR